MFFFVILISSGHVSKSVEKESSVSGKEGGIIRLLVYYFTAFIFPHQVIIKARMDISQKVING